MAPRAATGTGERVPLRSEEPPASEPVGPWRAQGPLGSGVLGEPHPEGVSGAFSCQMTWALGFSLPILGSGCFPFSPPRAKPLVGTLFRCHPFAPVGQKMNVLCHPPYSWGDLGDLLSPSLSQVLVPPHKPLPPLSVWLSSSLWAILATDPSSERASLRCESRLALGGWGKEYEGE